MLTISTEPEIFKILSGFVSERPLTRATSGERWKSTSTDTLVWTSTSRPRVMTFWSRWIRTTMWKASWTWPLPRSVWSAPTTHSSLLMKWVLAEPDLEQSNGLQLKHKFKPVREPICFFRRSQATMTWTRPRRSKNSFEKFVQIQLAWSFGIILNLNIGKMSQLLRLLIKPMPIDLAVILQAVCWHFWVVLHTVKEQLDVYPLLDGELGSWSAKPSAQMMVKFSLCWRVRTRTLEQDSCGANSMVHPLVMMSSTAPTTWSRPSMASLEQIARVALMLSLDLRDRCLVSRMPAVLCRRTNFVNNLTMVEQSSFGLLVIGTWAMLWRRSLRWPDRVCCSFFATLFGDFTMTRSLSPARRRRNNKDVEHFSKWEISNVCNLFPMSQPFEPRKEFGWCERHDRLPHRLCFMFETLLHDRSAWATAVKTGPRVNLVT